MILTELRTTVAMLRLLLAEKERELALAEADPLKDQLTIRETAALMNMTEATIRWMLSVGKLEYGQRGRKCSGPTTVLRASIDIYEANVKIVGQKRGQKKKAA